MRVAIKLEDLFTYLHKEFKETMSLDNYIEYKIESLNKTKKYYNKKGDYTRDYWIEGEYIYYHYSGHDGESVVYPVDDDYIDRLEQLIEESKKGTRYYYFEDVIIYPDGEIKVFRRSS